MAQFLDESGLNVLWTKIKNTFTTKAEFSTLDTKFVEVVTALPGRTGGADKTTIGKHLYLVKSSTSTTAADKFDEYIYKGTYPVTADNYVDSDWELLGAFEASVDLADYLKKTDAANTYATNTFSKVVVGTTTVEADSKADTLTLAGSNVTLTPDATNDKVTIGITKANVTSALGYTPMDSTTSVDTFLAVGASASATDNAAATNGNVYLNGVRNNTVSSSHLIKGTDGTTVTSDAAGVITVKSPILNVMSGASSSSAGVSGYVPAPAAGKQASFLRGDGTWAVPTDTDTHYASKTVVGGSATATDNAVTTNGNTYINHIENNTIKSSHKIWGSGATTVATDSAGNICITSTDTTYGVASTSANGLMSAAQVTKLDGIATSATADSAIPIATINALS